MNDDINEETQSYLLLHIGTEDYCVAVEHVREIARWRAPLVVPGAPAVMPAIINQRGVILPTVNIHALLGMAETLPGRTTRFVVVHLDDVDMAFVVDEVTDIIALAASHLEPVPSGLETQHSRFLRAITYRNNKPVAVLELSTMIHALRSGT